MATDSIIDRAALAASGAFGYAPSLVDDPEVIKSLGPNELSGDDWRNVVRAVLAAIREPGDALFDKAMQAEGVICPGDYDAFWPAMIDAIADEGRGDAFKGDGERSEYVAAVLSPGMQRFVIAPGEDLRPGDLIGIDPATGKMRKVTPQHSGQKYTLPPGSRVTDDGYLEIPYNPLPIQESQP